MHDAHDNRGGPVWPASAERIIRRACGAASPVALLRCITAELSPHIRHRWSWIAEVAEGGREAAVRATWSGNDGDVAFPAVLPVGSGVAGCARGGGFCHADGCPEDPYDHALRELGVGSHVTFGADHPDGSSLLLTLAGPAQDSDDVAVARASAPAVSAALALPIQGASERALPCWAGLDPVEIVDYVCTAVAHDMRNALSGIIGAVELRRADVIDKEASVFDAVGRRALEGIAMADGMGRHLQTLVTGDAGVVDLADIAREMVRLIDPLLRSADASGGISVSCSCEPAPTVADAGELRRAMTALVFNAAHPSVGGDEIHVRTGVEHGRAILAISDNGHGMSRDVRRRAKEPFFTTRGAGHQGLGLTIAEGVARRFGGSLSVAERSTGKGSMVVLAAPSADRSGARREHSRASQQEAENGE